MILTEKNIHPNNELSRFIGIFSKEEIADILIGVLIVICDSVDDIAGWFVAD